MNKDKVKITGQRMRRKKRIRMIMKGTEVRPRLSVSHSHKGTYVQLIDDENGKTLVGIKNTVSPKKKTKKTTKVELAYDAGKRLAEAAVKKGITRVVFDRGRFLYRGRTKAVAEGARKGGLQL